MRILFITDRYPPYYDGGYELNCEITADCLQQKGHEVFVLTSDYGLVSPIRKLNIYRLLHCLNKQTKGGLTRRVAEIKNAILSRKNFFITKRVLKDLKPDLVYIWRMGNISIFPIVAVQKLDFPVVYELGDFWLIEYQVDLNDKSFIKRCYRYFVHGGFAFKKLKFDNLITVSSSLKSSYSQNGFSKERISVIPRGIPECFISQAKIPLAGIVDKQEIRLLYAGRIVPEKGAHIAVDALSLITSKFSSKKISLDIIGTGPDQYINELKEMIDSLGLKNRVRMIASMPRGDLLEMYDKYDVMLVPAIWEEPFGNTVIESMARNLPVIASRVGGFPEMIVDGVNGLLVCPNDSKALADSVSKLILNDELYQNIKQGGLKTILSNYRQDLITRQIENHLLKSI